MTFGAFISTRRKEAKLNLRDTAKHLGISNGYLCDIEQGRRPAPLLNITQVPIGDTEVFRGIPEV